MAKRIRVYEVARSLGRDSKTVIVALNELGIPVKNHMETLEPTAIEAVTSRFAPPATAASPVEKPALTDTKKPQAQRPKTQPAKPAGQTARTAQGQHAPVPAQTAPAGQRFPQRREAQTRRTGQSGAPSRRDSRGARDRRGSRSYRGKGGGRSPRPDRQAVTGPRRVTIRGAVPVRELAPLLGVPIATVLRTLMGFGTLISVNQTVQSDLAVRVAEKLGCVVTYKEPEKSQEQMIAWELERPDDPEALVDRPAVVTVMGHVDHGKTSLLDAIRNTDVTSREAGGITQHIGASVVEHDGNRLIFLDTPGHEAFTAMRARGAKVTDVAVLVVAADDGVMPQTIEAINHAKAAGVPVVVAMNKMDKPNARPDRVKQQLSDGGLVPEDWGGDTVVVPVSAKTKDGLDDLLEMIVLVAEMQEVKTDPTRKGRGYIIESLMDKGRGPVATALIRSGFLKVGDVIITDTTWGRIRAMFDGRGKRVKKAGPAIPVEIIGLEAIPQAGDLFVVVEDERVAKDVTEKRLLEKRQQKLDSTSRMTLEDFFKREEAQEKTDLKLIVKSDVQGSLEAIVGALGKIKGEEVDLQIIHQGVGGIIESDIMLAKASNATVMGFNVRPDAGARAMAEADQIEIRTYRVIYDLLDDVQSLLKGLLKPKIEEVVLGRAEIRRTFHVPRTGTVAGCYVMDGKVSRQAEVRLLRDGVVVYEGKTSSLKRFKDDVSEVSQGYECGIGLERYQDLKPGDIIEAFTRKETKQA